MMTAMVMAARPSGLDRNGYLPFLDYCKTCGEIFVFLTQFSDEFLLFFLPVVASFSLILFVAFLMDFHVFLIKFLLLFLMHY